MLAPTIHAPGIYFGLDEATYHADPALGSTSIKAIVNSPIEYQFNRLYGEEKDTDALLFGQAMHKRILEGRSAFEARFCKAFDKTLIPDDALDTVDDLRNYLDKRGVTRLAKWLKPELIQAVQRFDPVVPIVDVIKKQWEYTSSAAGKTPLTAKRWGQVEIAARWAQEDPLLGAVMEDGAFIQGAPEVSIFYEDRGVRLKARLDRMLRHAIVDLKTFAPIFQEEIKLSALKAINRFMYDVQAAAYLRAWQQAKTLFLDGHVFGDEPVENFLAEAFENDAPRWIWVMIKSTGAPQPLVIEWTPMNAMAAAAYEVETAVQNYINFRDKYGDDKEWPPRHPAFTVGDSDLMGYFGRRNG